MKKPTRAGLEVAVSSEKGLRDENQDWLSWTQLPRGELFIVADGMGGYKGGVRAAKMTVDGVERCLTDGPADLPFEQALQDAVSRTNAEVHRAANCGNPETEHMGSTVVVALVADGQVQVGHVGDSRAYLYRNRKLRLLTHDHTRVQQMLDAGMLTPEQARTHPESHVLSRAVGSRPDVEVEIGNPVPLEEGDALLLCSDGLSGYVTDEQICKTLDGQKHVQGVPAELVKLAMSAGGADNVTVQFVRVGKFPRQAAQAAQAAATATTDTRVTARLPLLVTLRVSENARRAARNAAMSASLVLVAIVSAGLWWRWDGAAESTPAQPPPASTTTTPATPPAPAAAAPAGAGAAPRAPAPAAGGNASTPVSTTPAADASGVRATTPADPAPVASQTEPSVSAPVKPTDATPPAGARTGGTPSQPTTQPKNGASATTKQTAPAKKAEPAQAKPRANPSPAAPKPPAATPAGRQDAAVPTPPEEKTPEKKPETKPPEEETNDRENKPPADEPNPEKKP